MFTVLLTENCINTLSLSILDQLISFKSNSLGQLKIVCRFNIVDLKFNFGENLIFKSVGNGILNYDDSIKEMLDGLYYVFG
jgi:hypothetical protein